MPTALYREVSQRVDELEIPFNRLGTDPYGISKRHLSILATGMCWLYRNYFEVQAHDVHKVPARGRAMLIGNHSGGIPLDGAMVAGAVFLEMDPPRLAQGMIEKFFNRLPFTSEWTARVGQFTGLPEHCTRLLEDERLLMVFPEGARGTAKLYPERNSLVRFGTGFMRLALQTGTPIVPFGFLGGGDAVPTVINAYRLGNLIGLPYVPITPYVLPLPMPVRLDVTFGEPLRFEGTGTEDDEVIFSYVDQVKATIRKLIDRGRRIRRGEAAEGEVVE